VNSLKTTVAEAYAYLKIKNLRPSAVPGCPVAVVLDTADRSVLRDDSWIAEGKLYSQNLSSMIPPMVLGPRPGERVLDLCAAPGSKTTQMAAMMGNEGAITAVEAIRGRFFKLKTVCELMGAKMVRPVCMDGRRFEAREGLFDRVLVDAPCSSEGMFDAADEETTQYWSERKIDEMSKKQRGLLLSASRLLKPGGTMVYSTCTFAPEENEGTVDWLLKKAAPGLKCVPVDGLGDLPRLAGLDRWEKRIYHPDVRNAVRILPGEDRIGFFIAKFMLK
jgi:16S rRNA (cytosine1407-C5)-methyltransferase